MTAMARFPFSAVVGQSEARLALLLAAVDPGIGGVLLRGDKGAAKSTLARGLAGMLPGGAPFVEMPLGATEDRVVGTIDPHASSSDGDAAFRPGLLAGANGGVLYVDEVNLLPDHLVDMLLDAATSGINRVERDGVSHSHPARFVLVGSMNPEEGELRPQLLDRFGLSVEIKAPTDPLQRAEVVRRRLTHDAGGRVGGAEGDIVLRARLAAAMPADLPDTVVDFACRLAVSVGAEGLRADLVLCRAAAAFAGWEGRSVATSADVERVAPLALGHRRRRRPYDPPVLDTVDLQRALESARQSFADAYPKSLPAGPPPPETDAPADVATPAAADGAAPEPPSDIDPGADDGETGAVQDGSHHEPVAAAPTGAPENGHGDDATSAAGSPADSPNGDERADDRSPDEVVDLTDHTGRGGPDAPPSAGPADAASPAGGWPPGAPADDGPAVDNPTDAAEPVGGSPAGWSLSGWPPADAGTDAAPSGSLDLGGAHLSAPGAVPEAGAWYHQPPPSASDPAPTDHPEPGADQDELVEGDLHGAHTDDSTDDSDGFGDVGSAAGDRPATDDDTPSPGSGLDDGATGAPPPAGPAPSLDGAAAPDEATPPTSAPGGPWQSLGGATFPAPPRPPAESAPPAPPIFAPEQGQPPAGPATPPAPTGPTGSAHPVAGPTAGVALAEAAGRAAFKWRQEDAASAGPPPSPLGRPHDEGPTGGPPPMAGGAVTTAPALLRTDTPSAGPSAVDAASIAPPVVRPGAEAAVAPAPSTGEPPPAPTLAPTPPAAAPPATAPSANTPPPLAAPSTSAPQASAPQASGWSGDAPASARHRSVGRTVVVAVDASGSTGTHRRVEAATSTVLGLLSDAYLRRDRVAMVTFRGDSAEVVLPPTASVELARTRLAELPTGGVTPLAEGIGASLALARRADDDGWPPLLVLITDGRATGHQNATERADAAAAEVAEAGVDVVVIDADDSASPAGRADRLAAAMGGRCVRLDDLTPATVESTVRDLLR